MAAPVTPTNPYLTQANGQILLQWDQNPLATEYLVYRSQDNIGFTLVATITANPTLANSYLDNTVSLGTAYYYQVAAGNGSGVSSPTTSLGAVPSTSGELSLGELRLRAQQRADRVNSQFVTLPEWNYFINQSLFELYDLLITTYEEYFVYPVPVQFNTDGSTFIYNLPDGITTFINGLTGSGNITPPPFYKLKGVDLGLNTANNAFVTVKNFNFNDRNKFLYPNSASTIYGVFNLQYRLINNKIQFIPTPSAGQPIRLWYIPRLTELLQDTDVTTTGISGWLQYVIVRAAKYALDKEEADTTALTQEILGLRVRIEETSINRDQGMPDTISDVNPFSSWGNSTYSGFKGGW